MSDMAVSRKQRMRTLENQIRQNYEAFVQAGFALKEIRDDELYREDGFETWDAYLKDRIGHEFGIEARQAYNLIACAQIRPKLPESFCNTLQKDGSAGVPQAVISEFGRLAPKDEESRGSPRDYGRLDKRDVQRVASKVIKHCEEEGTKPTAPIVRKYVDEELGIDRAAQARETRRQQEEESHPEVHRFLIDMTGRLEAEIEQLSEIADNADVWTLLRKKHPGVMKRFVTACDSLADLVRRLGR